MAEVLSNIETRNDMGKQVWKPGNMVYPLPAVLVSVRDLQGNDNLITVAWTGTICSNPPLVYISVRKERFSHHMLKESGEFVINLTTERLAYETDYCGVKSGRDVDKFEVLHLHKEQGTKVNAPLLKESPVNIECKVTQVMELGSHDMFLAEVVAVDVDEAYMDEKGKFDLSKAALLVYSHGDYFGIGKNLGHFGYSVRKSTQSKRNVEKKKK